MLDTCSGGEELYVPVTCKSSKTIALARALYVEYGIEAWTPRVVNKNPKKGQKRIRAALPGFVFVPLRSIDEAKKRSARLEVPKFTAIVLSEKEATCKLSELQTFDKFLRDTQIPKHIQNTGLSVGDNVTVETGPFEGLQGKIDEVYVDVCLMVKIKSDKFPAIRLPAAYLTLI